MIWFIVRRLAGLVAVLFTISVLVFLLFNVIPGGDPALRLAGRHPTQQNIEQIARTGASTGRCRCSTWRCWTTL